MTSGLKQKYSLNFVPRASVCYSFFFFFELWHSHKQRYPLPQQLHHVRLLPLPFWFCCWMPEGLGGVGGEDLAHAPPPSERAAALGFLLSG